MKKNHTLIVGGTRGIGRAIAKSLAKNGHIMSVIGRRPPIPTDNKIPNIHYWILDLLDWNAVSNALTEIIDKNGKLNNLIFCQRYKGEGDKWAGEIDVSITVTKKIIESLAGKFNDASSSSIVVISSIAGNFIAQEQPLSYHIAKASINQMVRYYAVTLGHRGIRVNCVSPCTILKEESREFYLQNKKLINLYKKITPLGRMGTSEEIADVVTFLCSPNSSFITGQNIIVDGGIGLHGHESLARRLIEMDNT